MTFPPTATTSFSLRTTLSQKLGVVFGLIVCVFGGVCGVVWYQVSRMHTSLERVLEEHREDEIARDLLRNLQSMEAAFQANGAKEPSVDLVLASLLDGAETAFAAFVAGPAGRDPSDASHQAKENVMFAELRAALTTLRTEFGRPEATTALHRAHVLASSLQGETQREAREAVDDLEAHGASMSFVVFTTAALAFAALLAIWWSLSRQIVRPIRLLAEGARHIAEGRLNQEIAVSSADEVGLLTAEFNAMARRLADVHAEQERRVAERTRDFLRAARLADMGTMAAGIAHEINNPLASIASCAEGLERRVRNGGARLSDELEYLQIIAKEAYRAHEITSRLLDFAHQDGAQKSVFGLGEIVHETRVFLEHRLSKRNVMLSTACDPSTVRIFGSSSEWKQVLLNLIQNAFDASPDGGRIDLRCRAEGDYVTLEIEDQGPGIPVADLERVFDPFFTTKAPGKGTGLGLAIVARIVEAHEGRITAHNTGHGALFQVRVPRAKVPVS
jgi:signal transduction histidine kinase